MQRKTVDDVFLSQGIRNLIIAEIVEHEDECGQYTVQELAAIEQHYLRRASNSELLSEYQNYFGRISNATWREA